MFKVQRIYPLAFGCAASLAVYQGPFPETRKGIFIAWNFPYRETYKDTLYEKAWQVVITGFGGFAGLSFVNSFQNAKFGSVGSAVGSVVLGGLTARICYDQSANIVSLTHRMSKLSNYAIDGIMADVLGRGNSLPVWEKVDGLTVDIVKEFLKVKEVEEMEPVLTMEQVQAGLVIDQTNSSLLTRHKHLIIENITSLRREEDLLRIQKREKIDSLRKINSKASRAAVENEIENLGQRILTLENEKVRVKQACMSLHDEKLSEIMQDELHVAVSRLSEMRKLQEELVLQLKNVGPLDALKVKRQLSDIDVEKFNLKAQAKTTFGIKIASMAVRTERWKNSI